MDKWQILEKYSYHTLMTMAGLVAFMKEENLDSETVLDALNGELNRRKARASDNARRYVTGGAPVARR